LSERRDHAALTTMREPINGMTNNYHKNTWNLFTLYLEYILGTPDSYWNPCAYHLYNAREASGTTREAFAAALSIAVEGIANLLPTTDAGPSKTEKKHVISALLDHLREMPEGKAFEQRVAGLLK
jgi:hypothetical protein